MKTIANPKASAGFTIVELLIATTVLSVLLLLATLIITNIGNLYYKGVNSTHVQDDTRDITAQLSQDLQTGSNFAAATPLGSIQAICTSGIRYRYVVGKQVGSGPLQTPHVLWRDANPNPGSCVATAFGPAPVGTELIAPGSRLADFDVHETVPGSGVYIISVAIAFGSDPNLLCSTSELGTCTGAAPLTYPTFDIACLGGSGDRFCATSSLKTTVVARIR